MIRLFVAIDLPEALRQRLAALGGGIPGANWIDEDDMHLTLRFVGEVDEGTAQDIDDALAALRAPAAEIRIAGVGHFGEGAKPRLLHATVERTPALMHLRDRVDAAVVRAGCPHEGRKFTPHVTLARLKGVAPHRVQMFLAAHSLFRAEPFVADRVILYSSFLAHEGAIYQAEAEYPLG